MEVITNPNGANGTTSDPREQICWDFYIEDNLNNAYAAAIKAKYSEDSARNITTRDWFKERLGKLRRKGMLSKAERNLDKVLDMEYEKISKEGETKTNTEVLKVVVDVSKTVVTTLGKDDGYSTRTEQTGKDGAPIHVISFRDKE